MYNRKQRREIEKNMGLLSTFSKLSQKQKFEISHRKIEAGKQIHLKNIQELENQRINQEADAYAKQLQRWMESGKTQEEAEAILTSSRQIQEARAAKKAARKERQKEESVNTAKIKKRP